MPYIVKRCFPDYIKRTMVDHFVEVTQPRYLEFIYHGDFNPCKGGGPATKRRGSQFDSVIPFISDCRNIPSEFVSYIPKDEDESKLTWEQYRGETKKTKKF
jgi:hypothetical protein